jgi:hypothetical protein
MTLLRKIALYLLVLLTTGYAALGFFFVMCPFEQHFDTLTYIKYWQTVDGYMGKRMPIYGMTWLVVFAINIVVFAKTWRKSPILWIILLCLVLVIADMVFTVKEQIPLNQYIQTLDFDNLSPEQSAKLQGLREQINANFGVRDYFQWAMFFLMSVTPYLLPKLEERMGKR